MVSSNLNSKLFRFHNAHPNVHTDVSLWNDMFLLTYTYAEKHNLFVSDINHKFEYLYH